MLAACDPGADTAASAPRAAHVESSDTVMEAPASAEPAQRVGALCPDPANPCPGFRSNDLSFVLPRDSVARAEVRSDSFYAVILRSGARCSITAADVASAQPGFPRKVFAERMGCEDDVENNVRYTGVSDTVSFLAAYGGSSRAEADSLLSTLRASGRYPGANLRRMQVVFVYP